MIEVIIVVLLAANILIDLHTESIRKKKLMEIFIRLEALENGTATKGFWLPVEQR